MQSKTFQENSIKVESEQIEKNLSLARRNYALTYLKGSSSRDLEGKSNSTFPSLREGYFIAQLNIKGKNQYGERDNVWF